MTEAGGHSRDMLGGQGSYTKRGPPLVDGWFGFPPTGLGRSGGWGAQFLKQNLKILTMTMTMTMSLLRFFHYTSLHGDPTTAGVM